MTADDVGQQLHDKATRGVPLTPEEQTSLQEWYAQLDQAEGRQLAGTPASDLPGLRQQVQDILTEIILVSQKIQALTRENEDLRRQIAVLQEQLARKAS